MRKAGLEVVSISVDDRKYAENIRKALLCGYYMQVAHRTDKRGWYKTVKDEESVRMNPSSALPKDPAWVMYDEIVLMVESRCFIRTCSEVEAKWLVKIAPHYFDLSNFPPGVMKDSLERVYRGEQQRKAKKIAKANPRRVME